VSEQSDEYYHVCTFMREHIPEKGNLSFLRSPNPCNLVHTILEGHAMVIPWWRNNIAGDSGGKSLSTQFTRDWFCGDEYLTIWWHVWHPKRLDLWLVVLSLLAFFVRHCRYGSMGNDKQSHLHWCPIPIFSPRDYLAMKPFSVFFRFRSLIKNL